MNDKALSDPVFIERVLLFYAKCSGKKIILTQSKKVQEIVYL